VANVQTKEVRESSHNCSISQPYPLRTGEDKIRWRQEKIRKRQEKIR
jgi:hypothetical protein